MQPELVMTCPTDSNGLLAKEEGVVAMGAASQTRGSGLFVAWDSPIPRAVTFHCSELGSPTAAHGHVPAPDPACALPLGLALAFHDGSVHIVHRLSLQTMAIFYSSTAPRSMDEPAIKRPRTTGPTVHFKAMQLSWTSLALVGIDNHGKVSAVPGTPKLPTQCVCVCERSNLHPIHGFPGGNGLHLVTVWHMPLVFSST